MNINKEVIERIRELCVEKQMDAAQLAERARIDRAFFEHILNGQADRIQIVDLQKICMGLDIDIIDFFSDDRFR